MSRKSFFNRKFNCYKDKLFILDYISNILSNNGKKQFSQKLMKKIILELQKKIATNAFLILSRVLSLISPRIKLIEIKNQAKEGNTNVKKKTKIKKLQIINNLEALKLGLISLYNNAQKRKEKSFVFRFVNEIIDSYFGNSVSFNDVEKLEQEIIRLAEQENIEVENLNEEEDYLDEIYKVKTVYPAFYDEKNLFKELSFANYNKVDISKLFEDKKIAMFEETTEKNQNEEKEKQNNEQEIINKETEKIKDPVEFDL